MDPLAESFYPESPYGYALNNPVYFINPTGMSSESSTESENPCEKEGDCVDLSEVLVIGKKKSSNPYDNANVAANAQKLYSAIGNTPATKDIDKNMLIAFSMVNPFQKIMNDYQTEGEVDPWDVAGMIPVFRIYKITKYGTIIEKTLPVVDNVLAKGVTAEGAVWAQKTFSAGGKFAGQTVEGVAGALRSGTLSAADVPINVVVRNGQTFILNTRSSAALMQAGIPRSVWNIVNQTGVSSFERMLTGQLGRNGLINGINTIKQSSTQLILSH